MCASVHVVAHCLIKVSREHAARYMLEEYSKLKDDSLIVVDFRCCYFAAKWQEGVSEQEATEGDGIRIHLRVILLGSVWLSFDVGWSLL